MKMKHRRNLKPLHPEWVRLQHEHLRLERNAKVENHTAFGAHALPAATLTDFSDRIKTLFDQRVQHKRRYVGIKKYVKSMVRHAKLHGLPLPKKRKSKTTVVIDFTPVTTMSR